MAFEVALPLAEDAKVAGSANAPAEVGNRRFLRVVVGGSARFHHCSTDRLVGWPSDAPEVTEPSSSLLLRALHMCFSAHLPLSLSPDVLWYAVVHEVAVHVRLDPDTHASLFTDTPGQRQTITVRDDSAPLDWERKYRSASGGAWVTGWINAFFAHRYGDDGPLPKDEFGPGRMAKGYFPSHVSRVPFVWRTLGGTFDMAFLGGVLGIERDGEWIRPRLGNAVVEPLLDAEPGEELLPGPWTLTGIRRRTGCPEARILDTPGVVTHDGEPLHVDCAIDVQGLCVVRSVAGDWYLGHLTAESGDIECWECCGPDLGNALRSYF
ncbi:DUF4419 domain-containing protein [Embleya sp. NBC_00888]|uniref:DUF4419 domain-containing protein n=1 Tax=Embleya sp. NBC_00888 TaxID=2975960 RepID=UPI00386EDA8C|nr:DUF4419 domain-containing protein [Embleya sp. NBC_00888]